MRTPRWHRFLSDTFGEGPEGAEMIDFLHLLLGYSITGDVGGQIMPFLFGSGRNGKSVLLDVLMKLLGDYADAAPPGFLMARPYEGHPTDLAELHGRRVIVLGFDGMDYGVTKRLMAEGRMPNFSRLAQAGSFSPLGTTIPPQSPVAWSSFITGLDPGGHGIFDFVHRDPKTMVPNPSPLALHAPPETSAAAVISCTGPPAASTFLSFPPATNAI